MAAEILMVFPEEGAWDWIIARHAETAWASLLPALQAVIPVTQVQAALSAQVAALRQSHGVSNQVFVAVNEATTKVGYVWVGEVARGFTGIAQAHIFNLFVEPNYRGQGIGALLMDRAEAWAEEKALGGISLSVAAHNQAAAALYQKSGYVVETFRMFKSLKQHGDSSI